MTLLEAVEELTVRMVHDAGYAPIRVDGGRTETGINIEPISDDEHIGFKKLEGELAHEPGVHDPAAVAAKIGREKYGKEGMEKKAAAGRAGDSALRSMGLVRK